MHHGRRNAIIFCHSLKQLTAFIKKASMTTCWQHSDKCVHIRLHTLWIPFLENSPMLRKCTNHNVPCENITIFCLIENLSRIVDTSCTCELVHYQPTSLTQVPLPRCGGEPPSPTPTHLLLHKHSRCSWMWWHQVPNPHFAFGEKVSTLQYHIHFLHMCQSSQSTWRHCVPSFGRKLVMRRQYCLSLSTCQEVHCPHASLTQILHLWYVYEPLSPTLKPLLHLQKHSKYSCTLLHSVYNISFAFEEEIIHFTPTSRLCKSANHYVPRDDVSFFHSFKNFLRIINTATHCVHAPPTRKLNLSFDSMMWQWASLTHFNAPCSHMSGLRDSNTWSHLIWSLPVLFEERVCTLLHHTHFLCMLPPSYSTKQHCDSSTFLKLASPL